MSPSSPRRIERDSLGEREVPASAYYGIQTLRAVENFPISGWRPYPSLVKATVQIKKAAARTNATLGVLDARIGGAIESAADEVLSGAMSDQFIVDPFQAGAGTSHNMNVNEVLANRAIELLGGERGDYTKVHPNDHVNMGQSTNDVFPTAMRLAAIELSVGLVEQMDALASSLEKKAVEFDDVLKSGRTHLQDAVPIRLGQEFGGYAAAIAEASKRVSDSAGRLKGIGLGGTAVGTGLNAAPGYRVRVLEELKTITRYDLKPASNYFGAMQSMSPFVDLS
ncbi:MAG: lyase family protein, partial [Blastocatellia bacterium]